LIDEVRKELTKDPLELNIFTKYSKAYVNSKTIQKGLFDLTIFVNKTHVEDVHLSLEYKNVEDYYLAIAMAGIATRRLDDFIKGKR